MEVVPLFPVRSDQTRPVSSVDVAGAESFSDFLVRSFKAINEQQLAAEKAARRLALGEDIALHEVVLASQRAALSLELATAVRNKVIEAYQEIMRMQI